MNEIEMVRWKGEAAVQIINLYMETSVSVFCDINTAIIFFVFLFQNVFRENQRQNHHHQTQHNKTAWCLLSITGMIHDWQYDA